MALEPSNPALMVNNETLPNPLALLTQMDSLRQLKNQNLLFRQTNDAKVGLGQIYGQAVGPDGSLDEAKLKALAAQDPRVSFMLPEIIAQAQARQKEGLAIEAANLTNTWKSLTMISETMGGLVQLGADVTEADVLQAAGKLAASVGDPAFTKRLITQIKGLPKQGPELAAALVQIQKQTMTAESQFALTHPAVAQLDLEGKVDLYQAPRLGEPPTTVGTAPKTGTTAAGNELVPVFDAEGGVKEMIPRIEFQRLYNGDGTLKSNPRGAPDTSKPSPGQVEAAAVPRVALEKYKTDLNDKITAAEQLNMQQEHVLKQMDIARTGGLAEKRSAFASLAQAFGVSPEIVATLQGGGDPKSVAAAEVIAKQQMDMALQRLRAQLPPGTQMIGMEFSTSMSTTPGLNMDPRAVKEIFNYNNKLAEYKKAEREFLDTADVKPSAARRAWTEEAVKRGLLEFIKKDTGSAPPVVKAGVSRGNGVPPDMPLSAVPDGSILGPFPFNGKQIKVRRQGNSLYLVE